MIRLTVAAFGLLACANASAQTPVEKDAPARVDRKFDRFKNATTFVVTTSLGWPEDPKYENAFFRFIEMTGEFNCSGDVGACRPSSVVFEFAFRGRVRVLYQGASMEMLLNDKPVSGGAIGIADTALGPDDYFEIASIELPVATFSRMCQAEKVEIRVAGIEFRLRTANFESLNALQEHIAAPKKLTGVKKKAGG